MSTIDKNKTLSRRYFEEIMSMGKLEVADEIFSRNYVEHDPINPPDLGKGPAAVRKLDALYRTAFPDSKMTVLDLFATGDNVVIRWSARGTQKGELFGIPATGRVAKVTGISIFRIEGEKIAESWNNWDALGMMQQLGVVKPTTSQKKKAA